MQDLIIYVDYTSNLRESGSSSTSALKCEEMFFLLKNYIETKLPEVHVVHYESLSIGMMKKISYLKYSESEKFEVYMFDQLLFSRKQTARWPDLSILVNKIQKLIASKTGKQISVKEIVPQKYKFKPASAGKEITFRPNVNHRAQSRALKQRPTRREEVGTGENIIAMKTVASEILELEKQLNTQIAENIKEMKAKVVARPIPPIKDMEKALYVFPKISEMRKEAKKSSERDGVCWSSERNDNTFLFRPTHRNTSFVANVDCTKMNIQVRKKKASLPGKALLDQQNLSMFEESPEQVRAKISNIVRPYKHSRRYLSSGRRVKTEGSDESHKRSSSHMLPLYDFDAKGWDSIETQDDSMSIEEYTSDRNISKCGLSHMRSSASMDYILSSELDNQIKVEGEEEENNSNTKRSSSQSRKQLVKIVGDVKASAKFGKKMERTITQTMFTKRIVSLLSKTKASTRYADLTTNANTESGEEETINNESFFSSQQQSFFKEPAPKKAIIVRTRRSQSNPHHREMPQEKQQQLLKSSGSGLDKLKTLLRQYSTPKVQNDTN